jgi:hypothetical protein
MCILPNSEFQLINPTTQLSLYSKCIEYFSSIKSIQWNIYQGTMNSSTNATQWISFNQTNTIEFFGKNLDFIYYKFYVQSQVRIQIILQQWKNSLSIIHKLNIGDLKLFIHCY